MLPLVVAEGWLGAAETLLGGAGRSLASCAVTESLGGTPGIALLGVLCFASGVLVGSCCGCSGAALVGVFWDGAGAGRRRPPWARPG